MEKRTPTDFILDEIRMKRAEYTTKRDKETDIEEKKRKEKKETHTSETSKKYLKYDKENRMLNSDDYSNLRKTPCPEILCLDSNTNETIKFLKKLPGNYIPSRRSSRSIKNYKPSKIKRYFDFASVKKICPASALIISSCYFIYKRRGGKINILDWEDWDEDVKDTLTKMGFLELLEFEPIKTDKKLQDIPIKSFRAGSLPDNEEITTYVQWLVQRVNKNTPDNIEKNPFKDAIPAIWEAVENSVRHAYPDTFLKNGSDMWWFGGTISPDATKIILICYDKGISIPRHIKEADIKEVTDLEERGQELRERVRKVIARFIRKTGRTENNNDLDHKMLELATKSAVTSTEKDGSGRGLSSITKTIKDFSYGEVKIMSRRASAVITQNKGSSFTLLDTPIIGTLIIWKITL